jgi:hypothetical protein
MLHVSQAILGSLLGCVVVVAFCYWLTVANIRAHRFMLSLSTRYKQIQQAIELDIDNPDLVRRYYSLL